MSSRNNEDSSDCADAQSDRSLRWAQMLEGTFSSVTVQDDTHVPFSPCHRIESSYKI